MSSLTNEQVGLLTSIKKKFCKEFVDGYSDALTGVVKLDMNYFLELSQKQWEFFRFYPLIALTEGEMFAFKFLGIKEYLDVFCLDRRDRIQKVYDDFMSYSSEATEEDVEKLKNFLRSMFDLQWEYEYTKGILICIDDQHISKYKKAI